ncbi:hypothetical protein K2173_001078 [Erythroxylum novogranatense]|uniref:Uncharacterized protein n=1 Tax=Erythroxylum novogranatense TaxID=1862640 RepID=A0AAV8SIF2_9ROSI|nr:hypothetical protein K2173_001078 [Erythroxylum novogranatense]
MYSPFRPAFKVQFFRSTAACCQALLNLEIVQAGTDSRYQTTRFRTRPSPIGVPIAAVPVLARDPGQAQKFSNSIISSIWLSSQVSSYI